MKRWLIPAAIWAVVVAGLWFEYAAAQSPVVPCAQGQVTPNSTTPSCATTITPIASASAESTHVFKAAAGSLVWLTFGNTGTNTGALMVLNQTTAPTNGATVAPLICVPIAASVAVPVPPQGGVFVYPLNFSTGIVAAASAGTSCTTYSTTSQPSGWFSAEVQ